MELASFHSKRGFQQGWQGRDTMAEDSQQSQSTSLESQYVSDLRGARSGRHLVEGFTATHIPDALDRVNSILLARRKSRTATPAAQTRRTSASPDARVSSTHAPTAGIELTNQPVDMPVDEVEQSSFAQNRAVPSGMYSNRLSTAAHRLSAPGSVRSVPLVKKRMRAFDDDVVDANLEDVCPVKQAKTDCAVDRLHDGRTSGRGSQQGVCLIGLHSGLCRAV